MIRLLDKHAPETRITVRKRNNVPWFDDESRTLRREVRRMKRMERMERMERYRKEPTIQNQSTWKSELRRSRRMSQEKSSEY